MLKMARMMSGELIWKLRDGEVDFEHLDYVICF